LGTSVFDMNHVCETKPEVPFTKPGVAVGVLVYQNGKLLFGKRLAKFGYGFYSIPGGKLEYGETIESAAARELEEETGLKAENFTLAGYTDDTWADRHWVTIYLETDTFHGEVKNPEPDKCAGWEFYDTKKLPDPLWTPISKLLKDRYLFSL
jgi:8-oxo-dGTP diphosphatase